jgi:hypothetical protein
MTLPSFTYIKWGLVAWVVGFVYVTAYKKGYESGRKLATTEFTVVENVVEKIVEKEVVKTEYKIKKQVVREKGDSRTIETTVYTDTREHQAATEKEIVRHLQLSPGPVKRVWSVGAGIQINPTSSQLPPKGFLQIDRQVVDTLHLGVQLQSDRLKSSSVFIRKDF